MDRDDVKLNTRLIGTLSSVLYIPAGEILDSTGISTGTWYRIMKEPDILTIQQLLAIANGLHIPVKRFFYTGSMLLVGHRDDYITDSYQECRYDSDVLQEFMTTSNNATWKHAAEIIGVTRDNLRNSLLGARRTPVTRFLQVCNIFGIDPFTILIDPNPEQTTKGGRHTKSVPPSFSAEISKLRQDMTKLSDTVADLTRKYDQLQQQLDELAGNSRREVHVHIVAEDIPDPTPDD